MTKVIQTGATPGQSFFFPAALMLISFIAFACANVKSAAAKDGDIVARQSYVFPAYEAAEKNSDVEVYATKQEYENAVKDPDFEFEKLKYLSDDLKVVAYLYKPRKTNGKKYPAIIFNRGGAVRGDIAVELISHFHRLASEGFVILAPLYRQSDGGEGRDEIVGRDVNDLMNILPVARSLDFIDSSKLFMYGQSRGGMMTYQAVKNGFPIKAAAVYGAITDIEAYLEANRSAPAQYRIDPEKIWSGYSARKEEIVRPRSAIYWAEKLDVPLLIMHGGADPQVNPAHSLNLVQQLQKLGKVYELLIYAGDNHILSRNKLDRDARVLAWFRKYLQN